MISATWTNHKCAGSWPSLKGAGFASAGDYLDVMKAEFVDSGGNVYDSLNSYARKAKRSSLRGLGPAAKASAPTFELLANLPDDPNLWLREIEAPAVRKAHILEAVVSVAATPGRTIVNLAVSKTDVQARGAHRPVVCI